MKFKRNTRTIVRLAAEKSQRARRRVIEAITVMQRESRIINFNTVCSAARVSKTILYDAKHFDLAEQAWSLRHVTTQSVPTKLNGSTKSDSAKDAQIARYKNASEHLKNESNHSNKKTNCSTAN